VSSWLPSLSLLPSRMLACSLLLHSAAQAASLLGWARLPASERFQRLMSIATVLAFYLLPTCCPAFYLRWRTQTLVATRLIFFAFPLLRQARGAACSAGRVAGSWPLVDGRAQCMPASAGPVHSGVHRFSYRPHSCCPPMHACVRFSEWVHGVCLKHFVIGQSAGGWFPSTHTCTVPFQPLAPAPRPLSTTLLLPQAYSTRCPRILSPAYVAFLKTCYAFFGVSCACCPMMP